MPTDDSPQGMQAEPSQRQAQERAMSPAAAVQGRQQLQAQDGSIVSTETFEEAARAAADSKDVRACTLCLVCARVYKVRVKVAKNAGELFVSAGHKVVPCNTCWK